MKATIKQEFKDYIKDLILDHVDNRVRDLHHYWFNEDYYIIGHYEANQWLKRHNVDKDEALGYIIKEENETFGEIDSDRISELLESDEKFVNNYVYWLGCEFMSELESIDKNWDRTLDEEIAKEIIDELD